MNTSVPNTERLICNKLSLKQQQALHLMLAGYSIPETAEKIGVRRETVWRWLQKPNFLMQLQREQNSRKVALGFALIEGAAEAIQALRLIVTNDSINPMARVKASKELLERCGFASEQTIRFEGKMEAHLETVRLQRAKETGDENAIYQALQEDLIEFQVVLQAIQSNSSVVAYGKE